MRLLRLTSRVLREPARVVDETAPRLAAAAPDLLLLTALGAGLFGAVLGAWRGGAQIAFAAVKLPLLLLLPVMLTLPAVQGLFAATGQRLPWPRVAAAGLVGMARTAALAAAAGPLLWLVYSLQPGYHAAVLLMAASLALVGLPGLRTVGEALPAGGPRRGLALGASLALLALVTMQTGWLLRPFIARPTAELSLLRPLEGDVFSAMGATSRSARGDYRRAWEAEAPPLRRALSEEAP